MTTDTTETADVHAFTMETVDGGKYAITLDGQDVAEQLAGVRFEAVAGEPFPLVVLQLSPLAARSTKFDALARVVVEETDPGPAAAAFLAAIDPELLEQEALKSPDLTNEPHALTAQMLRILQEWARGRS